MQARLERVLREQGAAEGVDRLDASAAELLGERRARGTLRARAGSSGRRAEPV